jgi:hypothetical protein
MSHERDAIARAFSRPFIEPPKRATAKRVGLTLAGIALLAAGGLIFKERQPLETSNGVECTTESVGEGYYIDGIAPYRWLNPNAPANWLADVEKWREAFQVTSEHLAYEMGFWNVEGAHAYAVVSATLMVTIKGQTAARTGTLAYTFSKRGEAWKIDAQAWGCTS